MSPATLPLDKKGERIRQMFGAIAPTYDFLNHLLSLNIDRKWRQRVTRLVPVHNGPILDLCTGTGDLAFAYDRSSRGRVEILGADFCGEMLDLAVRKLSRTQKHRIHFLQADAQFLPFVDSCFEIVCVAFGLRNISDPDKALKEMIRVTRPGGRIAILEFSRPRASLLGKMYQAYFRYLLPLIGQAISRSQDSAYHYLPASVEEFPCGEALADRLRQHGLRDVSFFPMTFAIATLYVGVKP
jgi:demethylmenaquinone methyltransferase/2-methoxy-6-polyprenyl-1,4-benzoquinol methylase